MATLSELRHFQCQPEVERTSSQQLVARQGARSAAYESTQAPPQRRIAINSDA